MNTANTELSGVEWILLWAERGPCNEQNLPDELLQCFVIGKFQVSAILVRLSGLVFVIRRRKQSRYFLLHVRNDE